MVYHNGSPLSLIISETPSVLSLLNRLGIFLGVGNSSVTQSAVAHGINPDFLLVMINTYLNHDYFPEKELLRFPIKGICDYLIRTNRYYKEVQLPNIDRHFRHLMGRSSADSTNLDKMYSFFAAMDKKVSEALERYNAILGEVINNENPYDENVRQRLIDFGKEEMHPFEVSLNDLINLFIIHLKGEYDHNLCHAVLIALVSLYNDSMQNNRIHDLILIPSLSRHSDNA